MSIEIPHTEGIWSRLGLDPPLFLLTVLDMFLVLYIAINPSTSSLGLISGMILVFGLLLTMMISIAHPQPLVEHHSYDRFAGKYGGVFNVLILIGTPALIFLINSVAASIYVKNTVFNIVTDNNIYVVLINAGIAETLLMNTGLFRLEKWIAEILGFKSLLVRGFLWVINGVGFMLLHTIAYQAQYNILAYIFFSGVVLAAVYDLSGNGWLTAVSHVEVDVLPQLATLFKVSAHLIMVFHL